MNLTGLPQEVKRAMESEQDSLGGFQRALDEIAGRFEASSATIHHADPKRKALTMVAQIGLPEKLLEVTRRIPYGKGMAGICVERGEPVTVCNLQTDSSGVANPGAKEMAVAGAIVIPIFSSQGDRIAGTLGVGKPTEHDYSKEELETLQECGNVMAERLEKLEPGGPVAIHGVRSNTSD